MTALWLAPAASRYSANKHSLPIDPLGIATYQKIPSFQKILAQDQREEPRENPALAVDAPLLCDGFTGYHNTWPASGRHLLALLFGGLSSESVQPITDRPPSLLPYEIRPYRDFSSTAPH